MRFTDRTEAGRQLAARLLTVTDQRDVVVLALPRGGVPIAVEVARRFDRPFDVFLVRKLGVPGHPELAMGAIASGGIRVLDAQLIDDLGVSPQSVEAVTMRERTELERRDRLYRGNHQPPALSDRTVFVIDDGLATGSTMEAAVEALRTHRPARVVVAVPVGAAEACRRLARVADTVVCLMTPDPFTAVGIWYERFDQVSDAEVMAALQAMRRIAEPSDRTTT
jgi:putative phosphoribosyl transferase